MSAVPLVVPEGWLRHEVMSVVTAIVAVLLSFISLATFVANVLVLVAVGYSSSLRTVSNLFIVSLNIADILVAIIVMIPATLNSVYGEWILPRQLCPIWTSFDVMLCSASVLSICSISFDRYLAIITPLRYKNIMTFKRAVMLLAVMWSIAILSSFVPINNGWHNMNYPILENLTMFSKEPQCVFRVSLPYAILAGAITLLLPIIIALVLYFKVSEEAKRQELFVRTLIAPSRVLLGQDVTSKSVREPFTRKASITLGVIVGAYVVTWTPFLIANIVDAACNGIPINIFIFIVWLGYCNSLINPIIYPLLMRDFRKVYKRMFMNCCPKIKFMKTKSNEMLNCKIDKTIPNGISNSNDILQSESV